MDIEYRKADSSDLPAIARFVDYWLTGGGQADGIPGATHDYFVRFGQHADYVRKYDVMLACCKGEIVGWAVKTKKGVLIHLLVAATFRGGGIGSEMLRRLNPEVVRSKFDQKSGDPAEFYLKHGYIRSSPVRVGRKLNIELFHRANSGNAGSQQSEAEQGDVVKAIVEKTRSECEKPQRTIDVVAKKVGL